MERVKLTKTGKVDKRQYNGGNPTPGSKGRPVGSYNKMPLKMRMNTVERHIARGGVMPLDFMLLVLSEKKVEWGEGKNAWKFIPTWEDKKWAAERLLHCFTPKLTATTVKAAVQQVFTLPPEAIDKLSDEELAVMEKALGKLSNQPQTINGFVNGHSTTQNNQDIALAAAYATEIGVNDSEDKN